MGEGWERKAGATFTENHYPQLELKGLKSRLEEKPCGETDRTGKAVRYKQCQKKGLLEVEWMPTGGGNSPPGGSKFPGVFEPMRTF